MQEIYQLTETEGSNWNGRGLYTSGETFFFVFFFTIMLLTYPPYTNIFQVLIQEEIAVSKQIIFEQNYT